MIRLLVSVFALKSLALYAQTFGELSGTVTDPDQSILARAEVTIRSLGTSQVRRAQSSEAGIFRVPFLPPGEYEVTVEMAGFRKSL